MYNQNYKEYLDSYAWKSIKKTKLEENPKCECCGMKATTVHHLSYERIGRENSDDVVSVCESCHYECHHVGGYQIKNDEEILRKRFEEVRTKNGISPTADKFQFIDGKPYCNNKPLADIGFGLLSDGSSLFGVFNKLDDASQLEDNDSKSGRIYEQENDKRGDVERLIEDYGKDELTSKEISDKEIVNEFWYTKNVQLVFEFSLNILHEGKIFRLPGVRYCDYKKINDDYFIYNGTPYYNSKYFGPFKIKEADLKEFIDIGYGFIKDGTNIIFEGRVVNGADYNTFRVIDEYYSSDSSQVFYKNNGTICKIETADVNSFQVIDRTYSRDKQNSYIYGKVKFYVRL